MRPSSFTFAAAALASSFVIASCGGKTLVDGGSGTPGGGEGTTGGGSTGGSTTGSSTGGGGTGGGSTGSTGGTCVTIDLSTYDTSCVGDTDCISVNGGQLCSGACLCGGSAISSSEQARYESAISSIQNGVCPCLYPGPVLCLQGQCTQCGFGPDQPAGCDDSGDGGVEASTEAGESADTGVICVDIDLSTYDTSCSQDSDCIEITSGEICSGECGRVCGGSAVNASEQARYNALVLPVLSSSKVTLGAPCGCPAYGSPTCEAGQCVMCFENADGGCAPAPP